MRGNLPHPQECVSHTPRNCCPGVSVVGRQTQPVARRRSPSTRRLQHVHQRRQHASTSARLLSSSRRILDSGQPALFFVSTSLVGVDTDAARDFPPSESRSDPRAEAAGGRPLPGSGGRTKSLGSGTGFSGITPKNTHTRGSYEGFPRIGQGAFSRHGVPDAQHLLSGFVAVAETKGGRVRACVQTRQCRLYTQIHT